MRRDLINYARKHATTHDPTDTLGLCHNIVSLRS